MMEFFVSESECSHPVNLRYREFRIIDAASKLAFERLLGLSIQSDYVRITDEFYRQHGHQIDAIQMIAALRSNMKREEYT